jgi:hypothetical protein
VRREKVMKKYGIEKREDFIFGLKIETLSPTFDSMSDSFDRIADEVNNDKMRWSNCTDQNRYCEINKTSDQVKLAIHKSGVGSDVVSTITYIIIEV